MAKRSWRRDEYSFYNIFELDREPVDAPSALEGLNASVMSGDPSNDRRTYVVELPKDWKVEVDGKDASLEFFLLNGDLSLEGEKVRSGGYIHLPQHGGGGELRSETGALAIAFSNPDMPQFPAPYTRNRVTSVWSVPLTPSVPGAHSMMHRSLRLPDPTPHPNFEGFDGGPGGFLRVQYMPAGFLYDQEQVHHECFEEIMVLQGDMLMVDEGIMGIGSTICHPQEWWHAPFATQSGALLLMHTDAPMGYPWPERTYPSVDEIADIYFEEEPLDRPTRHIPWSECTSMRAVQETPEFRAWRDSPDGVLWHEG